MGTRLSRNPISAAQEWQELWVLLGQIARWFIEGIPRLGSSGGVEYPWWVLQARAQSSKGGTWVAEVLEVGGSTEFDLTGVESHEAVLEAREAKLEAREAKIAAREAAVKEGERRLGLLTTLKRKLDDKVDSFEDLEDTQKYLIMSEGLLMSRVDALFMLALDAIGEKVPPHLAKTEAALRKVKDKDTRKLEGVVQAVETAVLAMDPARAESAGKNLGIQTRGRSRADIVKMLKEHLTGTTAGC